MKYLILFIWTIVCSHFSIGQKPIKDTFVFVHGAWDGGWDYKQVDSLLTSKGQKVYRPTLTGLGESVHLADSSINLTTHINDIVNLIKFEKLHHIILVGHSYGGMVISGVAEQVPDRISKLIYLDAFVANDGESINTIVGPVWATAIKPLIKNGFVSPPGNSVTSPPTDVPQPLKTFTEPLQLRNPLVAKIPTFYILMVKDNAIEKAGFMPWGASRAKKKGWKLLVFEGGHYPMREQPAKLIDVLANCK